MNQPNEKPWAGRFERPTRRSVEQYTESISHDARLFEEDIDGSLAHAAMLERCGLLTAVERTEIAGALEAIRGELRAGSFRLRPELEDIHMNIEAALIERIGDAGAKLHTARSRNDQVATDTRLYVKKQAARFARLLTALQAALVEKAQENQGPILPGLTHMQHAQPVLLAHNLLAWVEMLERDKERLGDCARRADVSPLGACALAGTTLPTDPAWTAELLGFPRVFRNSMDAVSDRDYVIEFVFCLSLTAAHLSRLSEEWVLWASREFDFIDIDESYCTGSSIMPQKKNPDVLELARGKTGRVYGDLMALLTMIKGLPLAYNRDMQEDKEALFDAVDTVGLALELLADMTRHTEFKADKMQAALCQGYLDATSLAEYLVGRGVPFRDAHRLVGRIVRWAAAAEMTLAQMPLEQFRAICEAIGEDVYGCLGAANCVARYRSHGSSSADEVRRQIAHWKQALAPGAGG